MIDRIRRKSDPEEIAAFGMKCAHRLEMYNRKNCLVSRTRNTAFIPSPLGVLRLGSLSALRFRPHYPLRLMVRRAARSLGGRLIAIPSCQSSPNQSKHRARNKSFANPQQQRIGLRFDLRDFGHGNSLDRALPKFLRDRTKSSFSRDDAE
jgi:hypothetical protein